jgi:membrane associated rhomboid family serine protease
MNTSSRTGPESGRSPQQADAAPALLPVKDNISTDRMALVTLLLIALNVAVYVQAVDGALLPLAANLLFLWIFGNSLEDSMGRLRFLAFYALGGLVTVGVATLAGVDALWIVGATGAAAAVLGGYLVHYPQGRVLTAVLIPFFVTIMAIPALAFLGVWGALQLVFALLDLNDAVGSSEVAAYLAPLVGLVFGAAAVKLFATRRSPTYLDAAGAVPDSV